MSGLHSETEPLRAVILASGGLDSTVTAAVARRDGCALYFLTIRYGQRHEREVSRAKAVANALGVADHLVLNLDLRAIGGSALTSSTAVPKDRLAGEREDGIPSTYVPARNTIFLALAAAYAEAVRARRIYIGANIVDYSGYPDCRPEFLETFETVIHLGTKAGVEGAEVRIYAPLLRLTKTEIVRLGVELAVPFELTHSCYDPTPDGKACGRCDSCLIRLDGFRKAGMMDPVAYVAVS